MNDPINQEHEDVLNFAHSLPSGLTKEQIYVRIHERAKSAASADQAAGVVPAEPIAHLRFRAAQSWGGSGNHDIECDEWLEVCQPHEIGDDKLLAFPVYAAPQPPSVAPAEPEQPSDDYKRGWEDGMKEATELLSEIEEPFAWTRRNMITDDQGYAIGRDDPEFQVGAEQPESDGGEGWSPLYFHASPAVQQPAEQAAPLTETQMYRTGYGDGVRAAAKLCDAKYEARAASGHPREASTARALAEEIRNLQSTAPVAAPVPAASEGWTENTGKIPVEENTLVRVMLRDGYEGEDRAGKYRWEIYTKSSPFHFADIIKWRPAAPATSDKAE